ncbi:xanthine dehydrogenase small subunit [Pistricoccus aurantiacus]|nr:xanthine dehydrogenase small subunit [Pistricoccus aurantiacus]
MIQFYLNGQLQQCAASADTSVLELLRQQLGQTGTKEGCASGDCGACSVAIGEVDAQGKVRYHSANACIMPAHQLQGRHLVTVEGLAQGNDLHPAQAAMVDCHASQCGFCTPGIVMSLFTLHENQRGKHFSPDRQQLESALGGNLCRCTGYRPIRDAALAMFELPEHRPSWMDDPELGVRLKEIAAHDQNSPEDDPGSYAQPATLRQLIELRRQSPEARLVAGATDLWLENTQQLKSLDSLIDVSRVAELNAIEETDEGWWIGAAVTYTCLEPLLEDHHPAFSHLMHRFASRQVRNRGTLGGNIANASPIGDCPPTLLALDARLRLAGPQGEREIPLEDFFLDYRQTVLQEDEVIRAIFLPRLAAGRECKVWKLSKRREDDISSVLGAFSWRLDNGRLSQVRLAFGGMAAIPKRAPQAEAILEGNAPSHELFQRAKQALKEDFTPMTDARGSADYRTVAAANLLERLYWVLDSTTEEAMLHAYAH